MFGRQTTFRRTVAALVALPVLLFAVSFEHDFMRCRFTGAVVEVCACPDDQAPAEPKLIEQTCCERQTFEAMDSVEGRGEHGDQSGGTNAPRPGMPLASPFVVPTTVMLATAPPFSRATRAAVRARQPALILVKQSFLI